MKYKVGDQVKLLNEEGEGVIVELLPHNWAIVEIDEFNFKYRLSELIKVDGDLEVIHQVDIKSFENLLYQQPPDSQRCYMSCHTDISKRVNTKGIPELDLHIHELVDKPYKLSNSEMLAIQIQKLEHYIQACVVNSIREFVVIHGIGEGVLRSEVRRVLESHGNIEYCDADFYIYGYGATKACIKGMFQC